MSFERPDLPINDENKQEKESKFEAIKVLRNREYPTDFIRDKEGKLVLQDPDLKFINDSTYADTKEGSFLTISADPDTIFRLLPAAAKIKDYSTVVNFSEKNNQVNKELLEGSQNIGEQRVVEQSDIAVLNKLAEAITNDKKYKIKYNGAELLSRLYEASKYQGELDIITADPIEQMDKLGSGELLAGRTYDNIIFFSAYTLPIPNIRQNNSASFIKSLFKICYKIQCLLLISSVKGKRKHYIIISSTSQQFA